MFLNSDGFYRPLPFGTVERDQLSSFFPYSPDRCRITALLYTTVYEFSVLRRRDTDRFGVVVSPSRSVCPMRARSSYFPPSVSFRCGPSEVFPSLSSPVFQAQLLVRTGRMGSMHIIGWTLLLVVPRFLVRLWQERDGPRLLRPEFSSIVCMHGVLRELEDERTERLFEFLGKWRPH